MWFHKFCPVVSFWLEKLNYVKLSSCHVPNKPKSHIVFNQGDGGGGGGAAMNGGSWKIQE